MTARVVPLRRAFAWLAALAVVLGSPVIGDLRLLDAMHRQLRAAVAVTAPRTIEARLPGSRVTRLRLITGVAAHDIYHAGQIQLLKKQYSRRRAGR